MQIPLLQLLNYFMMKYKTNVLIIKIKHCSLIKKYNLYEYGHNLCELYL